MENLIKKVFELIKDYRSDENDVRVIVTENRIKQWVGQFEEKDREFILEELSNIFAKRYISKDKAKLFLKNLIEKLSKQNDYQNVKDFLDNALFLDVQPKGKSQKVLLKLLQEIIEIEYEYKLSDCGKSSKRHILYIDDILATGNTLFQDINKWVQLDFSEGVTNLEALKNHKTKLIFAFLFTHKKNVEKKENEFARKIDRDFKQFYRIVKGIESDNTTTPESKCDFVFPLENGQPESVREYQQRIADNVDKYTIGKYNSSSTDSFYRGVNMPKVEILYSSPENRIRFENIMLTKGIEILKDVDISKQNIRALGFSLPSQKDFGFGTLYFTWRNVPNNAPLVFWYSANKNFPLFTAKRGKELIFEEKREELMKKIGLGKYI